MMDDASLRFNAQASARILSLLFYNVHEYKCVRCNVYAYTEAYTHVYIQYNRNNNLFTEIHLFNICAHYNQ